MIDTPGSLRPESLDRAASWLLGPPLALVLAVLCLAQYATWAPNYLTWPWWADHDVFATAARSWEAGIRPYRDFASNNFPGTIYVFWASGKLFGWGATAPFWAFDALLVGLFGLALVAWSVRRLGRALPGLVGYALFLGYYLGLDYTQAAQRDWHGPCFAALGLLLVQAIPGGIGRFLGGLAMAVAIAFRPQVVLFLPAVGIALWDAAEPTRPGRIRAATLPWLGGLALGLILGFLPLVASGLISDFARSLATVGYGSRYNTVGASSFAVEVVRQFQSARMLAVPLALALLWPGSDRPMRRVALAWLAAFVGVSAYRPLSPVSHAYLAHPLMVVWAVLGSLACRMAVAEQRLLPSLRLLVVLLLLGLGVTIKPRFSNPRGSVEAVATLRSGQEPGPSPTGYAANPEVRAAAKYAWDDYRRLLEHLRRGVAPGVRVANALKYVPAVAGPTGRLSAFPAESIAWLTVVRPEDEGRFIAALRRAPDALVVWSPGETAINGIPRLERLDAAIQAEFEPDQRFGSIEVWRRKPSAMMALRRP
jgi:hypothetical protein